MGSDEAFDRPQAELVFAPAKPARKPSGKRKATAIDERGDHPIDEHKGATDCKQCLRGAAEGAEPTDEEIEEP